MHQKNATSYDQYLTKDTIRREGKTANDIVYSALTNAQNNLTVTVTPVKDLLGISSVESSLWTAYARDDYNNGAIVLLNHDVLEWFSKNVADGDYYILPSSVNEVLFFLKKDVTFSIDEMRRMIKDVNDYVVSEDDILSYSLYYYDSKTGCVNIAE